MSLLLTLNIFHIVSSVSIVNFEYVNADWVSLGLDMFMILREVKEINAAISKTEKVMGLIICDALRDLVLVVQFKKRQIHPWRSVNFSKVTCFSLQIY